MPPEIPERNNSTQINSERIDEWLCEQNLRKRHHEIDFLRYNLHLFEIISKALKAKPYLSIDEIFNNELTPTEYQEHNQLRHLEKETLNSETFERKIFLETIFGRLLDRTGAKRYAILKTTQHFKIITKEDMEELRDIEGSITESNLKHSTWVKSFLKEEGIDTAAIVKEILDEHHGGKEVILRAQ